MESISAFEIIKVGVGPSSSHTMGPWKAALDFLQLLEDRKTLEQVRQIEVSLYGSLAKTGRGHGTDIAVLLGLSGLDYTQIDTHSIPDRIKIIKEEGVLLLHGKRAVPFVENKTIHFLYDQILDYHPNGMTFCAMLTDGTSVSETYFSIGGGFVVHEGDDNDSIQNASKRAPYPCHSAADILRYCTQLSVRISDLVLLNEQCWRTTEEIRSHALYIGAEIKDCVFRGIREKGVLPGGLRVQRRAAALAERLLGANHSKWRTMDDLIRLLRSQEREFQRVNQWVSIFAMAVNEENASFGRVVTAPTNGASGVLPAVLLYALCFTNSADDDAVVRFLITAGEIGTLYKKGATISAAMGGCQAEIGVSSSMAAAALAEILGGSKEQVLQAAEIAMEHHLGMTCDPVAGLVQIPCIERCAMGAVKAITAAHLALNEVTNSAKITLDNVIQTMWNTAKDMNAKYKETSEGGLAMIPVNLSEC